MMIGMHPGEYIQEVFVEDKGLSQREIADKLRVSPSTVSRILKQEMAVSADMALRLEFGLGRSAESWLRMQSYYDLCKARESFQMTANG